MVIVILRASAIFQELLAMRYYKRYLSFSFENLGCKEQKKFFVGLKHERSNERRGSTAGARNLPPRDYFAS